MPWLKRKEPELSCSELIYLATLKIRAALDDLEKVEARLSEEGRFSAIVTEAVGELYKPYVTLREANGT